MRTCLIARLTAIAAVLVASAGPAQVLQPRRAPDFDHGLRRAIVVQGAQAERLPLAERMARWRVPGLSVAVIDQCRVVEARGYGITRAGGAAVSPDTLFQAASISKPVAAFAALRLVEAGTLDLDADVAPHLRGWSIPNSPLLEGHPVTLRRLLSHSAGLVPGGYGGYPRGEALPTLPQILAGTPPAKPKPVRVEHAPGSAWRYSGGGYEVAELLMTETAGRSFPDLVHELVLRPAGMNRSRFGDPSADASVAAAHKADGSMVEGGWHLYPELAAAGLWSTASDLARFAIAVMDSHRGRPGAILGQPIATEMVDAEIGPRSLGFVGGGEGRARRFEHGGTNEGYNGLLIAFPETCQGAVVLASSDNAKPLINEVMRAIADAYRWPDPMASAEQAAVPATPEILRRFVGAYGFPDIPDVPPFRIAGDDAGGLTLTLWDGSTEPILASVHGLFAPDSGILLRATGEEVPAATLSWFRLGAREPSEAVRVPTPPAGDNSR